MQKLEMHIVRAIEFSGGWDLPVEEVLGDGGAHLHPAGPGGDRLVWCRGVSTVATRRAFIVVVVLGRWDLGEIVFGGGFIVFVAFVAFVAVVINNGRSGCSWDK